MFSSANILQITDVVRRVVFLLSFETSEMFRPFVLTPKQLNLFPRSSQLTVQFSGNDAAQLTSFFTYSSKFGLKEPVVMNYAWDFSQSETEKY